MWWDQLADFLLINVNGRSEWTVGSVQSNAGGEAQEKVGGEPSDRRCSATDMPDDTAHQEGHLREAEMS